MENKENEQNPNSESEQPFMRNYIKALTPDNSLIEKYNNQYIYSENNFQPYSFCHIHFVQDTRIGVLINMVF